MHKYILCSPSTRLTTASTNVSNSRYLTIIIPNFECWIIINDNLWCPHLFFLGPFHHNLLIQLNNQMEICKALNRCLEPMDDWVLKDQHNVKFLFFLYGKKKGCSILHDNVEISCRQQLGTHNVVPYCNIRKFSYDCTTIEIW